MARLSNLAAFSSGRSILSLADRERTSPAGLLRPSADRHPLCVRLGHRGDGGDVPCIDPFALQLDEPRPNLAGLRDADRNLDREGPGSWLREAENLLKTASSGIGKAMTIRY